MVRSSGCAANRQAAAFTRRAIKAGRTLAVADVEVVDEDGKPVAVGRGAFKT